MWTFSHPHPGQSKIRVEVPLLKNGKPRIGGSDGKHAKKNARNAIHLGARFLTVGRFPAHLGQLLKIVEDSRLPLLKSDVINVDKQDNRAPACLMSSAIIKHLEATQIGSIGLAIYLYIIGEIIDAQQNRTPSHTERLLLLFQGRFFLEGWREYINLHPLCSLQTHFIAPELYNILQIFISSMISLILIYCNYYPDLPLLPWIHSTKALEHFFGCARTTKADFTMAEFIANICKTILLMHGEIRMGMVQAPANAHQAGYHHFYHNTTGIDLVQLATYPSNNKFVVSILTAWREALALLRICGMGDGFIPASMLRTVTNPHDLEVGNVSSDYLPSPSAEPSSRNNNISTQLETVLRLDRNTPPSSTFNEAQLANARIAATALYIHEAHQRFVLSLLVES
jgi:hypothetical protein